MGVCMFAIFGLICVVVNLHAIYATLFVRDFYNPGGKALNVLIHTVGVGAGLILLGIGKGFVAVV